jgi:excisionase family DNA binding protein
MLVEVPDDLLRPREVAEMFGVRTATVARWAREGKLTPFRTPGGHRRYSRTAVRELMAAEAGAGSDAERQNIVDDAVRLYDQGWSIRQVASRFQCSYGAMRRILKHQVTLRNRGGV